MNAKKKPAQFTSFNDFFYRKLKKGKRDIVGNANQAIIPADGRYLFVPKISNTDGFYIKGKKFCLNEFLKDKQLADRYENGVMIIARLCQLTITGFTFPAAELLKNQD